MAGRGGCHLGKSKVAILKKNDCMVLKFTVYIKNVISFSILAYISLEIGYFEVGHDYDVTVTSYLECWYFFVCIEKGDP